MRFFNSLRNSALAFAGQIVAILMGFAVRWLFIRNLGQDYLGVNSVMESMLMILSMTELGIGTSVAFALYKPIDENDEKRIGAFGYIVSYNPAPGGTTFYPYTGITDAE